MFEFITGMMSIDTFMVVSIFGFGVCIVLLCAAIESREGFIAWWSVVFALLIVVTVAVTPTWREWRVMTYEHAVTRLSNERANCISEGHTDMYCRAHLEKYIADSVEAWAEIRRSGLDMLRGNK